MEALNPDIVAYWSILPPVIAIVLALITKEVISSLIVGILSGTAIYAYFLPGGDVMTVFTAMMDLMYKKIGDNASMILFLALLGGLVAVITRAGGSRAYGDWAARRLNSRRGASLSTAFLGIIIFIDDYFNCLTVGTVMRPVTDKFKISREKLAYLIDATAAPVCIIAPISSWAASVISYFPDDTSMSGMEAFLRAVPMNLYAVLTLVMLFWVCLRKNADYGPMARAEARALSGAAPDDANPAEETPDDEQKLTIIGRGGVLDLVIPIVALIILAVLSMLFIGGYWTAPAEGESAKTLFAAFGDTDAGSALALASVGALLVAFCLFVPRRVVTFHGFFAGITAGIKTMVPALIILTLAWTISGVCRDLLMTGQYVAHLVETSNLAVALIPAIMFIVASLLAFSTGTSWGTFGILIPIIVAVCNAVEPSLTVTALSAILAGAVLGDHCSPISDTTILASTGARCRHIDHVSTQLPYVITVGAACVIGYLVAGVTRHMGYAANLGITLAVSLGVLIAMLIALPIFFGARKDA